MLGKDVVAHFPEAQNLLRLNLDVRRLSLCTAQRLMNHDARQRERIALALRSCRQEQGAHARRLSDADRRYIGTDVLHGVVDGETCRHDAAGAVDIKMDVFVGILRFKEEELRDDDVRNVVVDRPADENDTVFQEARINIIRTLPTIRPLDHHGNITVHVAVHEITP